MSFVPLHPPTAMNSTGEIGRAPDPKMMMEGDQTMSLAKFPLVKGEGKSARNACGGDAAPGLSAVET